MATFSISGDRTESVLDELGPFLDGRLRGLLDWLGRRSRPQILLISIGLTLLVGVCDYASGSEVSLSTIYAIPVLVATWYLGSATGLLIGLLSSLVWVAGDMTSGLTYSSPLVPVWNALIRLLFYGVVVVLLVQLKALQQGLERKVEERATALARESIERERLERDLLAVSEREQRRIGQDLHDGLCQHLTGTALACHVLAEKLSAHNLDEERDGRRIVDYIEEAISLARGMAKGLNPIEMSPDGLMQALDEFAIGTSEMFGVDCRFECDSPVLVNGADIASNLYRIAQEAVSNAIKHGHANNIVITLETSDSGFRLAIADNGIGFPDPLPSVRGMGLRIMANRARAVGATFETGRSATGGALIACSVPH